MTQPKGNQPRRIDEEFDIEFSGDLVVHLFETKQFEKIKDFIRQQGKELVEKQREKLKLLIKQVDKLREEMIELENGMEEYN